MSPALHSNAHTCMFPAMHRLPACDAASWHTHAFHVDRSFDAAGGASADANNEAVAALAGVRAEDIIMAEWHNSIGRPCHYVAVDRANHCIVLSIRWGFVQLCCILCRC